MSSETITRRGLFARLVGRGEGKTDRPSIDSKERIEAPAEALPEQGLIETYLGVLDVHRERIAFGIDEGELPEPREAIQKALVEALPAEARPALREALREAYGSLAWFTSGEELERLRAGRRALDFGDHSEEGKQTLVAAFAIRAEKVSLMAALEKEFDARVAARLAAPPTDPETT